jgi:hypothetical protein
VRYAFETTQYTATGRTKRAVKAFVPIAKAKGARMEPCTVPKGTEVRMSSGKWYVADLAWLEECEGAKIVAAGNRPGLGRTSLTYHYARSHGIEIDAKDVTGIKVAA